MNRPLRVGLVGAGMVSQYHVAGWRECPDAQLVAIADPDLSKAKARAVLVPGAHVFETLGEMISVCDLDAIDIVTPPATHAELIAEAQAAGLHVICQKPLAPNAAEAAAIVENQSLHLRAMVHENWRWRHPYRALKSALEAGEINRPKQFEFRVESSGLLPDHTGQLPALVRQPFFADMPQLLVFELLVHHLDTLTFLFGDLEIAKARLSYRCDAVRGEDRAVVDLVAGGISGRLIGDFCVTDAPQMPRDRLFLDSGDQPVVDGWSITLPDTGAHAWDPVSAYEVSYAETIRHFRDNVKTGERFDTEFKDALVLQTIVGHIYQLSEHNWAIPL
ncbi:Gfo/Idh/MocA family protein [Thiosulfatihalobacter marinus]|nr:Gfo/Idh/MocA family oxidoreductase [Thiosulfatihalobacter marinus]